jgi:hypothetical protein
MSVATTRNLQLLAGIVAASLIAACANNGNPGQLPSLNSTNAALPAGSKTFHFTHASQKFKVPAGVTELTITAYGARGGGSLQSSYGPPGAKGAAVKATIPVRPGQVLFIMVGGRGILNQRGAGGDGFNGGGAAGRYAYGGGGSSDVRTSGKITDRVLVAAGGGGTGESFQFETASSGYYYCFGGSGGVGGAQMGGIGRSGDCGGGGGGAGASIKSGGPGGSGGPKGSGSNGSSGSGLCKGGDGGRGKLYDGGTGAGTCSGSGAGAGGGYYGGGGGGSGGCCNEYGGGGAGGGAGGGSSYVEPTATHVRMTAGGGHPSNGEIIVTW